MEGRKIFISTLTLTSFPIVPMTILEGIRRSNEVISKKFRGSVINVEMRDVDSSCKIAERYFKVSFIHNVSVGTTS